MKEKLMLSVGILAFVGLIGGTLLLAGIVTGYGTNCEAVKAAIDNNIAETVLPAPTKEPGDGCDHGSSCGDTAAATCGAASAAKDAKSQCSMSEGQEPCDGCEGSATTKGEGKCTHESKSK